MLRVDIKSYIRLLYTAATPYQAELLCVGQDGERVIMRFYRGEGALPASSRPSRKIHILHLPYRELSNIFGVLNEARPLHLELDPEEVDRVHLSSA